MPEEAPSKSSRSTPSLSNSETFVSTLPPLRLVETGLIPYDRAWKLQEELVRARAGGLWSDDTLLFVEHPHVFTLGRRAEAAHLLDPRDDRGVAIPSFDVNRGGDITYHGPGQVVGYPVVRLAGIGGDVIRYLRDLEQILVQAVAHFGIEAYAKTPYTGVWADGKKIASIGVGVQRGYTLHGFALNVNTDLKFFDRIVPCGIDWVEMASLQSLLGRPVDISEVKNQIALAAGEKFNRSPLSCRLADLPVAG